jgi:hypothetical protein
MSSNDPEAIDALFSTLAFVFKFLVKQIVMNFQAPFARARKSLQLTGTKIITQSCSFVASTHNTCSPARRAPLRANSHASSLSPPPLHVGGPRVNSNP